MTNGDKFKKEIAKKSNDELAYILSESPCCYCYHKGDCAGITCKVGVKEWLETPCAENNPPETVNHPKHYNRDGAMECIREMVVVFGYEATINFCKLNAWKYRYRASEKNGAEDMAKSDWYIKMVEELTAEGYL